jgi:hypothetical protein
LELFLGRLLLSFAFRNKRCRQGSCFSSRQILPYTDIVVIDCGLMQHRVKPLLHSGRSGYVVDRRVRVLQRSRKHFLVDPTRLAVPRDAISPCPSSFESLQLFKKRGVLRSSVRIEEEDAIRMRFPKGPSTLTFVPDGMAGKTRLKAVYRIRVATIKNSSRGVPAIDKALVFPSPSLSGGSTKVTSTACRAWNVQPGGFSNSNATVRSATSRRLTNFVKRGNAFVEVMLGLGLCKYP